MDVDLFQARMLVALADKLAASNTYTASIKDLADSRMAVEGRRDLSPKTIEKVSDGVASQDIVVLLTAFWEHYQDELELYPASSRLLINPPSEIRPEADHVVTLLTQPHLSGSYGVKIENLSDAALWDAIFDDVVVFWGMAIDDYVQWICRCVSHGTTLTLVFPSQVHKFWLTWASYNLEIDSLLSELTSRFDLASVHKSQQRNVWTETFGLAPK